jgi:hypothetical protein
MNADDLHRYWQLFTETADVSLSRFEELVERIEAAAEKVAKASERGYSDEMIVATRDPSRREDPGDPQPGDIVRRSDGPNFYLEEVLEDGSRAPFNRPEPEPSRGAIWRQGLFGRWRRR